MHHVRYFFAGALLAFAGYLLGQSAQPALMLTVIAQQNKEADPLRIEATEHGKPIPVLKLTKLESVPRRTVLLIDRSTSTREMRETYNAAVGQLAKYLFSATDTAELVVFNTGTRVVVPFTNDPDALRSGWASWSKNPVGGTAIFDSLVQAISAATRESIKGGLAQVIVLSDGDDNTSDAALSDVINVIEKTGTRVSAIEIADHSPGNYGKGLNSLRKIAEVSGGVVVSAHSRSGVQGAVGDLIKALNSTWLLELGMARPSSGIERHHTELRASKGWALSYLHDFYLSPVVNPISAAQSGSSPAAH
jgi:hypothetical protein